MTNSDLYFPFKWQIFQLICLPRRSQKSLGSETGISSLYERMFTLKWTDLPAHFEARNLGRITFSSRHGMEEAIGEGRAWPVILSICSEHKCTRKQWRREHRNIERNVFHTCQNMLSIVLPKKPSLVSEETSLGPNIVINSSKSTCPSPASRREHSY